MTLGAARAQRMRPGPVARGPAGCHHAPVPPAPSWPRVVLHADMDAFFAAVEQLDRPELRGKPLLIGHPGPRGVVATASYEARPFGVGSAMPMALARRRCPDALVVRPRFERYQEVSRQVMAVFHDFSPKVEALSLDEAFLDMTGAEGLFGAPDEMGRRLKRAVREATGLTVSVGVSGTKYVAKVASDYDKPDGLTVVAPSAVDAFLGPLPVSRLWGVGVKSAPRLEALGLHTIADVAAADPARLQKALGSLGPHLWRLARGDDPREVIPEHAAKSVGSENTLERDVVGAAAITPHLRRSADEVARRLRTSNLVARGVRLKLKTAAFRLLTRQRMLPEATDSAGPLLETAVALLDEVDLRQPMRLVGLAAFELIEGAAPAQLGLFGARETARRRDLDRTLDGLRARFGRDAVRRASDLDDE